MNRDALQSALSQDGGISARAALAELETGADFEVFLNRTASAQQLWRIWSCRYEIMLDTGVTPRPGLAETITKLQAAGAAPVYTWRPSLDRRGASSLLSENLAQCVACW
ncbi:hypothetical protein [Streptomyces griseus]|uniref:hypothetical protein n=1 Tax=Streptomyces griseus TaxID=1911 RepID=UPI0036C57D6E